MNPPFLGLNPRRRPTIAIGLACLGILYSAVGAPHNWVTENHYRRAKLSFDSTTKTGFTRQPGSQTGIEFKSHLSEANQVKNHNLFNGAGLALGDVNGDGLCDIFFCQLDGSNALYQNLGNWKFKDITTRAGVGEGNAFSRGAAFADVDGDRDLDLVISNSGAGAKLFLNNGQGRFTLHNPRALFARQGATTLALADVDNDGDLDLYVANYGEQTIRSGARLDYRMRGNKKVITGRWRNRVRVINGVAVEFGEPDRFYLNDGKGNFQAVSWTKGRFLDEKGKPLTAEPWDMSLSVMLRDVNRDRHPDIYVSNDFQAPDRFWINDGQGRFQAIARPAIRQSPYFSMGADFADLNRDGWDDFLVVDMMSRSHRLRMTQLNDNLPPIRETLEAALDRPQYRRNMAYLNRGDGTYAEVAFMAGLHASDWSWCPLFLDVDLDGYEDVLIGNGHAYDTTDMDIINFNAQFPKGSPRRKNVLQHPKLRPPNVAFHNQGDMTFIEQGSEWGFDSRSVTHGMASADLDNDGDLDVVANCFNETPLLYRNDSPKPRIAVRLRGRGGNTFGIGARIILRGGKTEQSQEMICGGRYLSSDEPIRTFAATAASGSHTIEVLWRSGARSEIPAVEFNTLYEVFEPMPEAKPSIKTNSPPPLFFRDVSHLINHTHRDAPYDDSFRQPTLPRSLGGLGPGVAWVDINGDSHDDIVIGTGRGGFATVMENTGKARFKPARSLDSDPDNHDLTSIALAPAMAPEQPIVIGASHYELPGNAPSKIRTYTSTGRSSELPLPDPNVSVGPLSLGDFDHDGDLDLFVGGRCRPGQFPRAVSSFVFENVEGQFTHDLQKSKPFTNIGMVSASVLTDIDNDGWLDLLVTCDWGSPRVFLNDHGSFQEKTSELGLHTFLGLWNGIATGDFNNDGRTDFVASNWGNNTRFEPYRAHPIRMVYGDSQRDGVTDIAEAYYSDELQDWAPIQNLNEQALAFPDLNQRFTDHKGYSLATLPNILTGQPEFQTLEAHTLETTLFLNQGTHFTGRALPREAQHAPCLGLAIADFDGNGTMDLFLAQNFSNTDKNVAPLNAGRGLLLLGDGTGNLEPVASSASGLILDGDQRGAAVSDYDKDGRPDLVVAQNQGATRLFKNAKAKPGLRVQLIGSDQNPAAIGAKLRGLTPEKKSPIQEIQSGSGYWSQDSLVSLLPHRNKLTSIWIQWPDGTESTVPLDPNSQELTIKQTAP